MATLADLYVRIGASTAGLAAGMRRAETIVSAGMARITALSAGTRQALASAGLFGGAGVTAGMVAVGRSAIGLAANLEQAQIAFGTMLGSAQRANDFLRQLAAFAAKTPFQFRDLQDASRRMMAYGFEAERVLPIMTALGNAVAALGGGSEMISRVVLALGQMRAKGRVSGEEMRQLAEAGIPAWEILATRIGVDIPAAMRMVQSGAVDAATGIDALVEGLNARFQGAMERQSTTILGLWSTIKDNVSLALTEIGNEIIARLDLQDKLQAVLRFVDQVRAAFSAGGIAGGLRRLLGDDLAQIGDTLATRVAPAIATVVRGVRDLITAVPGLQASLSSMPLILDVALSAASELIKRIGAGLSALPALVNTAITAAIAKIGELEMAVVDKLANMPLIGKLFEPFSDKLGRMADDVAHWRDEANRAATALERVWNTAMGIEKNLPAVTETAAEMAAETATSSIIRVTTTLGEEIKGHLAGGFGRGGADGAAQVRQHITALRDYAAANPIVVKVRYQEEAPYPGVRVSVPAG